MHGYKFLWFHTKHEIFRTKRNISQAQLAEECDCSNGMIGAIEAGRAKPSFDMILSIATALKIHPADLFLRDSSITRSELKNQIENIIIEDIKNILTENLKD